MLKHRTLLLLSLTALLALASCGQEPNCSLQKHTPSCMKALAKQAQHQLDLERKAIQIEQNLQAREIFVYHMAQLSPLFILLGCLGVIIAFGALYKFFTSRHLSHEVLQHTMAIQAAEVQGNIQIALAEAETRKPLPSPPKAPKHVHYAPHIRIGNGSSKSFTPPLNPSQALEPSQDSDQTTTPQALPSALDILRDKRFIFGYDSMGHAASGTLASLTSFGVGGASGGGKTSTLVFWLAQAVLKDRAELLIIDPHLANPQGLAARAKPLERAFVQPPSDLYEAHHAITLATQILDYRRGLSHTHIQGLAPLYLCVDEWQAVMRYDPVRNDMQKLASAIVQEGRKFHIFLVPISHIWTKSSSGDMKHSITSHLVFKTKPDLARYQTGLTSSDLPKDLLKLNKGEYYLLHDDAPQKLYLPEYTAKDLHIAIKEATGNKGTTAKTALPTEAQHAFPIPSTLGKQGGSIVEARGKQQGSTNGSTKLDPDKEQILDLFRAGSSVPDIARQLSGKQSGRGYVAASERVQGVLREVLS